VSGVVDWVAENGVTLILVIPFAGATLLLFVPNYRLSARLNALFGAEVHYVSSREERAPMMETS